MMLRVAFILTIVGALFFGGSARADDCTAVAAGASQNITAFSTCKKVTNGTATEVCATTYSSGEWTSFYTNPPSGVTIAACPTTCTAPWGTVYADGTSNQVVSPARYEDVSGCIGGTPLPNCNGLKAYVTCSSGTLTCSDTGNGTRPCSYFASTSCTNETCQVCFTGETLVTMADGTRKPIQALKIGDRVRGGGGINTVTRVGTISKREPLYAINGGKAFVTGGHPFKTLHGWKAIDPSLTPSEMHEIVVSKLGVGDTLYADDTSLVTVQSIASKPQTTAVEVYNPAVDGDHTFYANGFLVHNKIAQ